MRNCRAFAPFSHLSDNDAMNKREVAEELGCSTRQVEKYVGQERLRVVEYVRGKSGREGVYNADEVARLKSELEDEQNKVIGYAPPPTALTAPKVAQGLAVVEHLMASLDRQHADADRIIAAIASLNGHAAQDVGVTDKLTLSLNEASQLSGLSRNHLRQAIEEKKLKARIIGKGWRVKRDDLDSYVKKL